MQGDQSTMLGTYLSSERRSPLRTMCRPFRPGILWPQKTSRREELTVEPDLMLYDVYQAQKFDRDLEAASVRNIRTYNGQEDELNARRGGASSRALVEGSAAAAMLMSLLVG